MSNIDFQIKVYDDCIEIIPEEGVKDNSVYNIDLDGVKGLYSNNYIDSEQVNIYTAMTPAYTSIFAIKSLIDSYDVEDNIVLYHIREASRFVDYVLREEPTDDELYRAEQYTKYKAAHECVLRLYIEKSTVLGTKGAIGDVSFDNQGKFGDISKLLHYLKQEAKDWEDSLRGYGLEGKARPRSTMRGKNAKSIMTNLSLDYSRGISNTFHRAKSRRK